jgi:NADH:ubiquinone oxidoreductase subunit F (NADH-binding)
MTQLLPTPADWPRVSLARAGAYDPDAGFVAAEKAGAWAAWRQAVDGKPPEALVRLVDQAGLRGRGGAGYPTAAKWRACREHESDVRYAVANGYEADPGAFLDRTLMELDPHAVVEGLAIAAYAVGATRAFVAVKADYALAIERVRAAVAGAEDAGYIGANAMDAGFDLEIEVRPVQGAFVLGEETVLLRALEGKRGMPEQRPPYPTEKGLLGRPTIVHNVETLAAVPWIVANGADAFAATGNGPASGTKLVQLAGAIARAGVAEVPLGTPLGEIVEQVGGGVAGKGKLKAVLVGGPAGGFLPASALDTPLEAEALRKAGAILGSGSLLVLDQTACVVELGRLLERFMSDESCGKCVPCRIGTRRLFEIADRFTGGRPRPTDVQLLQDLSSDISAGSLCGHGINAPNPLLSGMRYFAEEFEAHINAGICPAGVCRPLRIASAAPH